MSFNRSGYIGRAPGDSSIVLAKQYFQPTGAGKTFTFSAGYDPGLLDVYRNGVKLINVLDYAATDGKNIVLDTPVGVGSTVQVVAYKGFNLTQINSSNDDFNVGANLYVQSGFGSFAQGITANEINVSGIGTIGIGSFVDINVSGAATVAGTLVAGSFSGGDLTATGEVQIGSGVTIGSAGVATFTNGVSNILFGFQGGATAPRITLGDIAGNYETKLQQNAANGDLTIISDGNVNVSSGILLKVQDTTDATSTSTGALIISGGVGIAKSLHVGQNVTIGGTLTYEDVTNVDSIGLVTARAGLNVSGGQLLVGSGLTIGNAGIATFADGSATANGLHFGTDGDLKLYHNGSNAHIKNGTGNLTIDCTDSDLVLQAKAGENSIYCVPDAQVQLYYDNAVKLKTATTGINPSADSTDDLGTSAIRWRNIYGDTLYGDGSNLTNLPAVGLSTEALITSGITTVLDLSNAQDHKITATGICTITTSGGTEGESHTIRITNSGIATVGFSSYFQFAGGASPVLTKTDGAVNLVSFTVNKTATTTGITTELLTSVANNFS